MAKGRTAARGDPWDFSEPDQKVSWPYQKWYNSHIARRTRYGVVRSSFDRPMSQMIDAARDRARKRLLQRIAKSGPSTLMEFLDAVARQSDAEAFVRRARIKPDELRGVLHMIYRQMLPLGAQMRQLIRPEEPDVLAHVETLKKHRLSFSLAFLDRAYTRRGRAELTKETGIPAAVLLDLARRADLTRLWLMGGGMIRVSWALGYKGLKALQQADPDEYYERCLAHYNRDKGKPCDMTRSNAHSHIARMQRAKLLLEE